MGVTIGIDLGTIKSAVGAWINNKPMIIPDRNGRLNIPSEILIQGEVDHQDVFVGYDCRTKNKYLNNSFVVHAIKRMMGQTNFDREKWWYIYPQFTISYILAELKCMAEEFLNQDIYEAIIAIPSHYDLNQRRATLEAAQIAGFNSVSLINEATASALAFFANHPEESIIAVIDIGGGTTDVSVISWGDNVCEVLTVDGTALLGGVDFSNLLYDWLLGKLKEKFNILSTHITKTAEVIIKDEIELVKKELSENKTSKIYLPYLQINGQYLNEEFNISQNEFENLSQNLIKQIVDLIKGTIRGFEINSLLLLGGAGNTFSLKEQILKELKLAPYKGVISDTSVAIGAVIKASSRNLKTETLIIDCLPHDYGIESAGGIFDRILSKGETIPKSVTKEMTTTSDNQTEVLIKVFSGGRPMVSANKYLGSIEIMGIPPAPKGVPLILIQFDVNADMDITVTAKIEGSQKSEVKTTLKTENGIPEELLVDMCKKVSIWKSRRKIREY